MKAKKNWYTLFEIMIVLGVIIAIMAITMRFSSSRIENLQAQTSKDDFKNIYEQLLLSNMSSNYFNEERYTNLNIVFKTWEHGFNYTLQNEEGTGNTYTWFSASKVIISKITTNSQITDKANIELTPYQLKCRINDESSSNTTIEIESMNKKHCFEITTPMCKIENTECR